MNLSTTNHRSPASSDPAVSEGSQVLLAKIGLGLALLTFLIYLPVIGYTFVNYDDELFTTNNRNVAPGFTWEGIKWAFTSTEIDYWRPVSWLSHMLDFELFGIVGGMHHLSNLLIHIAATVMLFLALHRLTGAVWRSAMVAGLFAWHPLHVESVAWIAERKDVLCGFFWFYTFWAYARYVEKPGPGRYGQVLLGFALGVMSKPMIVTLPCVLLLLDFWPLRRVNPANLAWWQNPDWRAEVGRTWVVLKEKLPLFAIVLVLSLSTMAAQREVGTMNEKIPFYARFATMATAYTIYLRQTFWPTDLCVLNPLTPEFAPWKWAATVSFCVGLSTRFLIASRRFPFLPVGWFWFLGVLVPVSGLVQVGEQAHADRYTYVPLVGVFLLLVWGLAAWAESRPRLRRSLPGVAVIVLLACAFMTLRQLPHWEDSVQLFKRVIEVNPKTMTAYNNLAAELMAIGKVAEARSYLERAVAMERRPDLLFNLGLACFDMGDYAQAQQLHSDAFSSEGDSRKIASWLRSMQSQGMPEANRAQQHKLIAAALAARKDYAGAAAALADALQLAPQDGDARVDRAAYLAASNQEDEALTLLLETVQLHPTNALARSNLGGLLSRKGRGEEALTQYRAALELAPGNPDTRHNYAVALARNGRSLEARAEFETVLRGKPDHLPALQQLAWLLATQHGYRDAPRSLFLAKLALAAKVSPATLDVAAAANAAGGNFDGAVRLATQAIHLAREAKLLALEDAIRARLLLYQAQQPYTQVLPSGQ
ncbi:MAG: hypothetical protein RL514_2034 [Verrucomicrobiota bacterium]|jgi:tetratricopeptide (TPR) repeat protein